MWAKAIQAERNLPPHSSMIVGLGFLPTENRQNACILGDACCINSRYLIEEAKFSHVDNIDRSPLLLDGFYESPKLTKHNMLFGSYEFPQNTYDFVYGKSITFALEHLLPRMISNIIESLNIGGIFTAEWCLEQNEQGPASLANHEQSTIEKLYTNLPSCTLLEKYVYGPVMFKGINGKELMGHQMRITIRRDA